MSLECYKNECVLTDEAIVSLASSAADVYRQVKKKCPLSDDNFRFTLEELLTQFRGSFGDDKPCRMVFARRFGKLSVELSQEGPRMPWQAVDEDIQFSYDVLAKLGAAPHYSYSRVGAGRNRVQWEVGSCGRRHSTLISMVTAVVLAVITGLLMGLLPTETFDAITQNIVTPVFAKLSAVLSAVATPLVFFAVISGIIGIGDVKAFGKIGSKLMKRMLLSYVIAVCLMGVGCWLVYGFTSAAEGASQTFQFNDVIQMVLDMVPNNLFTPFSIDNDLQVIVIAIFIGVTMLILSGKVNRITDLVREGSDLVNKMMLICCKFLPVIVYLGIVKLICTSNLEQLLDIGRVVLIYLAINAVFIASMFLRARRVTGTPLKTIFPSQLPVLLINLTTQSQVAALPEHNKCLKEKFGIDGKFVDFALPLGIVVYMPSGAIYVGLAMVSLAVISGLPLSVGLLIRAMILSIVIAVAAPPIPGSALVVLPVMLSSCGIPLDALPLAVILATIIGYILPAFNGINIQLELLMTAKKIGRLDETKLHAGSAKKSDAKKSASAAR